MTPKEILDINGDFSSSPLLTALRRLDGYLSNADIPYAVVGGPAVVRNGSTRTTVDIDILIEETDWKAVLADPPGFLEAREDHGFDVISRVDIGVLFPGDEWGMEIPMPHPSDIGERDENLGAVFASPAALLELKCAVYRKKKAEDGIEIAAKDLYDVTELLKVHGAALSEEVFGRMKQAIASNLKEIRGKVLGF